MSIFNETDLKPFNQVINSIIQEININEKELLLANSEDFVTSFKKRILKEIFQEKYIELIKSLTKQKVKKILLSSLIEITLEQAVDEALDETYNIIAKEIKEMTLPESIIETWEEAKKNLNRKNQNQLPILDYFSIAPLNPYLVQP